MNGFTTRTVGSALIVCASGFWGSAQKGGVLEALRPLFSSIGNSGPLHLFLAADGW
jgi:hypothetical protein